MAKRLKISRSDRANIRFEKSLCSDSGIIPSMGDIARNLSYAARRQIAENTTVGKQIEWKFQIGDMVMFQCQRTYAKIRGMVIAITGNAATVSSTGGSQIVYCKSIKLIERLDEEE